MLKMPDLRRAVGSGKIAKKIGHGGRMSKRVSKSAHPVADDGLPAPTVAPWFRDKHRLLGEYVRLFEAASRKWSSTWFGDLYCGYGRCTDRDNHEICDGSTLVALKAMRKAGAEFGRVFINDRDADAVEACERRCREEGFEVTALNMSAEDAAQQIARGSPRNGLNFALLDPFSLGQLPFSVIRKLASVGKTDMMIHVSVSDLNRNFGRYGAGERESLDQFAPGWRSQYDESESLSRNRLSAIEHWTELLMEEGYISPDRWRNFPTSGSLIYRLVLIGRHPIVEKFWKIALDTDPQRSLF